MTKLLAGRAFPVRPIWTPDPEARYRNARRIERPALLRVDRMPFTAYMDQQVLLATFSAAALGQPSNWYVALSTTAPSQAKGSAPFWNLTEPAATANLTVATGTSAITSLSVAGLSKAITNGDSLLLNDGAGHTQTVTASANAAVGAATISVTSFTPNFNYPIGSGVLDTTQANGYARVQVANNNTNWGAQTGYAGSGYGIANLTTITFPVVTGTGQTWGTLSNFGLFDQPGGGNCWAFGPLSTNQVANSGDTLSFSAQQLILQNS